LTIGFLILVQEIWVTGHSNIEVINMAKMKKNPSKAGVSAASVQGDSGPTVENDGGGKRNSQNNQYKKR